MKIHEYVCRPICSIVVLLWSAGIVFSAPAEFAISNHRLRVLGDFDLGPSFHAVRVVVAGPADDSADLSAFVDVVAWSDREARWKEIWREDTDLLTTVQVLAGRILPGDTRQLVIAQISGSGRFLSYEVLTPVGGQMQSVYQREGIFDGAIAVDDGAIIESNSDMKRSIRWDCGRFVESPIRDADPIVGEKDVIVRYGTDSAGKVWIGAQRVVLHVGGRLFLRRHDGSQGVRQMHSIDGPLDSLEDCYIAARPGRGTVSLLQGYSDEIEIEVEVVP